MIKLLIGAVVACVIVIGSFMILNNVSNSATTTNVGNTVDVSNTYSYTIEGEVTKPGTYVLNEGITMDDLIAAAGGLTSNGDVRSFFETTVLTSGSSYYVGGVYDSNDICSSDEISKVNINQDDADALVEINGITSSIASSIVSYRTSNGTFTTIEGLLDVYGIGNATYRKIRNYVILHE